MLQLSLRTFAGLSPAIELVHLKLFTFTCLDKKLQFVCVCIHTYVHVYLLLGGCGYVLLLLFLALLLVQVRNYSVCVCVYVCIHASMCMCALVSEYQCSHSGPFLRTWVRLWNFLPKWVCFRSVFPEKGNFFQNFGAQIGVLDLREVSNIASRKQANFSY